MALPMQRLTQDRDNYLSQVRDIANLYELEDVVTALSYSGANNAKTYLVTEAESSAQTTSIDGPAQVLKAVTQNLSQSRETICIVENVSPEYINVLGSAWDIDPAFFVTHAVNPRREHLWNSKDFEPNTKEGRFSCIDGNFEYHGLSISSDGELNSQPNHLNRHCYRSTWEGVETITSNTRISYYRVKKWFCKQ